MGPREPAAIGGKGVCATAQILGFSAPSEPSADHFVDFFKETGTVQTHVVPALVTHFE
jgi:hypothetical protein